MLFLKQVCCDEFYETGVNEEFCGATARLSDAFCAVIVSDDETSWEVLYLFKCRNINERTRIPRRKVLMLWEQERNYF